MAKLPTRESLGAMPSVRSGRAMAKINTSVPDSAVRSQTAAVDAMARGATKIGAGIASIGDAAEKIQDYERQRESYGTEFRYQEFAWNQQRALDESKRDVKPGQAGGFADEWTQNYQKDAGEFLKTVPEHARADYEAKLFERERALFKDAATFGRTEQKRHSTNELNDAGEKIYLPRARVTPTEQLGSVSADYENLIYANPDLTPIEKDEAVRDKRAAIGKAHVEGLPPDKAISVLNSRGGGSFDDALKRRESRGDPSRVNQFGYAGLYQFGAPRLETLGVYKPGEGEDLKGWSTTPAIAKGKWSGEFNIPGFPEVKTLQDFRSNPGAQEAVYKIHKQKMDQEIDANGFGKYIGKNVGGVDITREGLQGMLHLGGVGSTKRVLDSGGNVVVKDANGTSLLDYARMGTPGTRTPIDDIPHDQRLTLIKQKEAEAARLANDASSARSEQYERQLIDVGVKPGATLPSREAIENDPVLKDPAKNTLLRQHDAAAAEAIKLQNGLAKFSNPQGGAFNPYDKDDRDVADKVYNHFAGQDVVDPISGAKLADGSNKSNALSGVVSRTGMVPKTAALEMRGALVSGDEKRVGPALQTMSNLLTRSPDAFAGVEGQKEFEEASVAYRHYVDDLGMSAQEATRKIIQERDVEYKAKVNARIKNENVDDLVKKKLALSDLESGFDPSWIPFNSPNIGVSPETRHSMYSDYAELAKDHYLQNGDWDLSKKLAQGQLKRVWGVSHVNGSPVVMRYPPERSPQMAGIENASEMIAKDAVGAIKAETGQDVDRKKIELRPIPGQTPNAYKSGQPVPYQLIWTDQNGVTHMLNPGRAFVADPRPMRQAQTLKRGEQFSSAQRKADEAAAVYSETAAP